DSNRLTQSITRLERAHAARQHSAQVAAEAAAREASLRKVAEPSQAAGAVTAAAAAAASASSPASNVPSAAASAASPGVSAASAAANPDVPGPGEQAAESKPQAMFDDPGNRHRRSVIAWITACVLLAVVIISAGTVMSIVTPVRRLLRASVQIARGNSAARVPRGGVKELDTLALAFNHMAEQLAIAQDAARDQQTQLEAKVLERTRQLRELAEADPLTRLANRRHFFTMLNSAITQARRNGRIVGVLFIDIDNFKNMNDSLGHAFGDQVLQAIARRLEEVTQPFGIAARLGGDEFTVLCNRIATVDDIREAGARLVAAFHEALGCADRDLVISVSVGASVFPEHADDAESLLRAADAALFKAKTLGRNQLALFSPELLEAARVKFNIEQGLRRAMERDEFELAFQPEVNLQNCRVEMVEALLRWRTPDGRIVLPGDFLPVAEESGLILQINDWVLRKAIETAARWHHDSWREARVAINVSSRQLFDETFVQRVQALLQQHRLPPECIEIELTENVLQTGQATIEALRRLRALGTAIALDDFGTGFSSLSSLDLLPLTRVKLDRSLVSSIDNSSRSAAIARATIALCQGLGLTITAEGIERPEQLLPLLGYPGLYAQGFLLSHPVSAVAVPQTVHAVSSAVETLIRQMVARTSDAELASALPVLESAARA
ncbi:MAG: EAL domain-containing protein, partial [Sinobacteraceae bacterium]|nr:EAL domain-containing protein [Nevskiaceae bacterium]